jgi:hypothetical protein
MRIQSAVAILIVGLALVAGVMVACSSGTSCKPGTVNLQVLFAGTASYADTVEITSINPPGLGVATTVGRVSGAADSLFVDVSFPHGYPANKTVTFLARALSGSQLLGESSFVIHLDSSCSTGSVSINGSLIDAFIVD